MGLARGLIGDFDFSFIDAVEGEFESLNAFVKLHFFEGVLRRAGAEAVDRYPWSVPFTGDIPLDGVRVKGMSRDTVRSRSNSSLASPSS